MDRSRLERQARYLATVAHHEAGHAVAAFHVGMECKALSIVANDEAGVYPEHNPYFSNDDVAGLESSDLTGDMRMRIENDAFVSLAGPWAQKEFNPRGFRRAHAESDRYQAVKLLSYVRGDNEILDHYYKMMDLEARNFVRDKLKWAIIHHLAGVLLDQPEMTGDEVRQAIIEGYHRPAN